MSSNHLLKPSWQHQDPRRRIKAIESLIETAPKHQEIIAKLALTDPEPLVQQAAINRLLDCQMLEELLSHDMQASAAQERLMYLLRSRDSTHQEIITAYLRRAGADVLSLIACQSPEPTCRSQALERITDQQQLFVVAADSTFAQTREAAAHRVEKPELLQQLWERVRKRDKNLARKLQAQLKKPRQDEQQARKIEARAEKIIAAMQALSVSVWTPDYIFHFHGLESQWEQLESKVCPAQTETYQGANNKVAAIVEAQNRVEATQEQHKQLLADARALQKEALSSATLSSQIQGWQALQQCWLDTLAVTPPGEAMQKSFTQFATTFAALARLAQIPRVLDISAPKTQIEQLEAAVANINLPSSLPEPAALRALREDIQACKDALHNQRTGEKARVESTSKQIARFRAAVRRKELRTARGLRKKLQARMEQPGFNQAPKLIDQLEKGDQELRELADWKDFAIQPKFLELYEQMETLAESPQPPRQQAEQIKTLQQTWKALNALAPEDLWQRFQQAGAKAYKPCAAFYAAQERQRSANLEQRKVIVTQLEALAGLAEEPHWAEAPDWKDFRSQLQKLHSRWHQRANVNHREAQETNQQYATLSKQLDTYLQAEYAVNLAHKQRLLDRANAVSNTPVTRPSLDEVKALQKQWKAVGITDHKEDQKLWRSFREACDKAFGTHKQQLNESRAEGKNRVAAAKQIIQNIKALAKGNAEVPPDKAKMLQLEQEFKALPELPAEIHKTLARDVSKAVAQVQKAGHRFKAAEADRRLKEMRRRAELCATIEWAKDKHSSTVKALETDWDLHLLPAEQLKKMDARRDTALKKIFTAQDFQQAERERRLICIELETLLNQDSPAEDKDLRMEYQLQLLKSRGLHANQDTQQTTHQLHCRWYQMPAASKQIHPSLDARFHSLQAALCK